LIAVRNKLGLRHEKCVEQGASQGCIVPMKLKIFDTLFLGGNVMLAKRNVPLSFPQMSKMHGPIHFVPLA
jgi:hypothetical protein